MRNAASATAVVEPDLAQVDTRPEFVLGHSVLRLMPDAVQDVVETRGQWRRQPAGACETSTGAIGFVTSGVLAVFDQKNHACVSLHGAGSMFGWESALRPEGRPTRYLPLVDTEWIEVPCDCLTSVMGAAWIEHVFAHHALDRLARVEAQASCNAVHPVPRRLANWIWRLDQMAGPELRTTQAILAGALGVQRTSVNGAIQALQQDGVLRVSRGRLTVIDRTGLRAAACGC